MAWMDAYTKACMRLAIGHHSPELGTLARLRIVGCLGEHRLESLFLSLWIQDLQLNSSRHGS